MPQSNRRRRTPQERAEKVLRPVHPNAGIEAEYQRRLNRLIGEMHRSVLYWLSSAYRANQPRIAADETPADALRRAMREMASRWLKRFDEASSKLAEWFGQSVQNQSSAALKKILKDGGISVEFKMTPAMRDVLDATVNQNVSLIKSIPQQYLGQVEGSVMRSVQTGRDLATLSKELEARFGVTKRRAAFIARSQNNLATTAMSRARQLELGLDEAVWVHSGGGKTQRRSHVKASQARTRFSVAEGWLDPDVGEHIWPGQLPNCRCVSRAVVKGFS
ncbi:phage minor head protein [Labrys sp. KB_33_2]|uniref:phage head morphogenesis protein n=1 Tax=Labrys sp. KB_33_2 TaxID=3237479 RepID=UPI003F8E2644